MAFPEGEPMNILIPDHPPDLIVPHALWPLNTLINDAKRSPFAYKRNKEKKEETIGWLIKAQKVRKITKPFWWIAAYTPSNLRSDLNNVAAGTEKVVLDALQKADIIPDDRWKWIKGIISLAMPAKKDAKVEIWLEEENDTA